VSVERCLRRAAAKAGVAILSGSGERGKTMAAAMIMTPRHDLDVNASASGSPLFVVALPNDGLGITELEELIVLHDPSWSLRKRSGSYTIPRDDLQGLGARFTNFLRRAAMQGRPAGDSLLPLLEQLILHLDAILAERDSLQAQLLVAGVTLAEANARIEYLEGQLTAAIATTRLEPDKRRFSKAAGLLANAVLIVSASLGSAYIGAHATIEAAHITTAASAEADPPSLLLTFRSAADLKAVCELMDAAPATDSP
jgi:hypothetical protein